MGLLNRQAVLAISFLIISPFLVYYITTLLFYRKARDKGRGKTPPTVPYYVPGIFHAFSLATTGPQKYLAQLIKEYGDFAPFYINAGPQGLLVVRNPSQVDRVITASKALSPTKSRAEILDKLFCLPQPALELYAGKGVTETDKATLENVHLILPQKHLTGTSLTTNVEVYASLLSESMNNKMFQEGTWTQIEDTWSFFRQVVTRCILESLFGTDLFKQYPGVIRDYWEFSDAIEGFIPVLPRYWVPSAASPIRDRLLQGIEKWLKANHSGLEFARTNNEDPVWDDFRGSKFLQEIDSELASVKGMDIKSRAAEMLSIVHESSSTIFPRVFWTLIELLRRPQLANGLITSIDRYSPSQGATYNISAIADLPLIDSLLAETTRLRVGSVISYTTSKILEIDDHWRVPQDTPILVFSHDIALNTESWAKARSQTVEKSLDQYWAERFLVPNQSGSKARQRGQRNDVSASSFSGEGLESLNISMGDNHPALLGHEYVRTLHAATLAILLNKFELQLSDPDTFDAVVPPVRESAYGTLKPLEKIPVRLRVRSRP